MSRQIYYCAICIEEAIYIEEATRLEQLTLEGQLG